MKKITLIAIIFLAGLTASAQVKTDTTKQKEYVVKLNENQIQALWSALEFAKTNLQTSQAPANSVKNVNEAIQALEGLIKDQYIKQTDKHK